jgi:7-carboxy-7-deazaguanine synthase
MTRETPLVPREIADLAPDELFVNETFLSIQGESTHAGKPCFFIRLAGCHLRCVWCDTEYAFHEGYRTTVDDCLRLAAEHGANLVEVTGGEPLLQRAVYSLLSRLCDAGHTVLLETSGAVPIDGVDPRVLRIVDWKAPGSGEERRNHPGVLSALRPGDELKLVLADRRDYEWARSWLAELHSQRPEIYPAIPVNLSPVWGILASADLARWILEDGLDVRLNLQLHKVIWPAETRGV